MPKRPEQPAAAPAADEAPAEHPVLGHEPLYVPQGVTLTGILERLDALERWQADVERVLNRSVKSTK